MEWLRHLRDRRSGRQILGKTPEKQCYLNNNHEMTATGQKFKKTAVNLTFRIVRLAYTN